MGLNYVASKHECCKGCKHRRLHCHSLCKLYKKETEEARAIADNIRTQKEKDNIISNRRQRSIDAKRGMR